MAISIDWPNKIINVPKADTALVSAGPPEIRSLSLDTLRLELGNLLDSETGMPFPITHEHTQPLAIGGVTLARVVEIINGYTFTPEDGAYALNLVGANSNIGDVTNLNSVSIRTANSAGLTYSKEIEDQSFQGGRVFIDTVNGRPGTAYPRGTTTDPTDSFADADTVLVSRNLPMSLLLNGTVTLTTEDISGYNWLGGAATHDTVDLGTATTAGAVFERLKLQGTVNGTIHCSDCILAGVSDFEGFLVGGAIGGTVSLVGETHLVGVHAAATGNDAVTLDFQGNAIDAFLPEWDGNLIISNHSNAGALTAVNMNSGKITLDASCTGGTIVIRGSGMLVDNSAGATVVNEALEHQVYKYMNLDSADPMEFNETDVRSVSGDIDIDISDSAILPAGKRFARQ